jgi:mannan endo-1,4-beta-mannosidase
LKKLQAAGVPVLWRPLHEASGGWFWWGAKGAGPYLELYKLLFDRLTKVHKLNNLIWVWSGQDSAWYPGDEFVDIIGEDIYAADHVHASEIGRYDAAKSYTKTPKIITMSENGPLPDPDLMKRDGAWWSWFITWSGYIEDESKTTDEVKKRVFNSPLVITLDELPDLKNFPLKD